MNFDSTFAALRYRNFRLWFAGQTLSLMGTWMQSVAQGWVVYLLTGSELALGTITFLGTIPTLFLMLPAGALIDRVPRRRLLLMTQTAMMLMAFTLAVLAATKVLQVWHVGLLAVGLGIANSFDAPARQSMAVEMVEDRADLSNAIALNSTIFNLARVVGPAIGGIVLAALGPTWCFALNGFSFLAVLIALSQMRLPEAHLKSRSTEPFLTQLVAGLRYVRHNQPILAIIALSAVSGLFGMSFSVLMPVFAADVLRVGEAGLGGMNAAMGVGALAGSLLLASLGHFKHKGMLVTIGSVLFPIALLGFGFSKLFPLSLVMLVASGFAVVTQNASMNTLIQQAVPDELRGRVMAVYMLMFFGTAPFGSLQAGAIAEELGPGAGVAIGAAICLVFAVGVILVAPALRRLEG